MGNKYKFKSVKEHRNNKYNQSFICKVCKRYLHLKLYMEQYDMCTKCHHDVSVNFNADLPSIIPETITYADSAIWKQELQVI